MIPEALIQKLAKYTPQWADLLQKYGLDALKASLYINSNEDLYEDSNTWQIPMDIVSCVRKHDIFGKRPDINDHTCCIVGEFHAKKKNSPILDASDYDCKDCIEHSMQLFRPASSDFNDESDDDRESHFIKALTDFLNHVEEVHA